jgi:DNA gyrase subunit B
MSSDKKSTAPAYDESSIQRLDPIEHVRLRPGMYFGGKDKTALHHLVFEVMNVGIDEALSGKCSHIELVLLQGEQVRISDNSEGLRVEFSTHTGQSDLEMAMTWMGTGTPYPTRYKVSGGIHGVGIEAVNALCADMRVQVRRDSSLWQQRYAAARPQTPVEQVRPLNPDEPTGNTFIFTPDFTIMERNSFDFDMIAARCREVAHTIAGLRLMLRDERVSPAREVVFHAPEGIRARLAETQAASTAISDLFYGALNVETFTDSRRPLRFRIEVAFQYTDATHTHIESFVNTIATTGGTHVNGFMRGLSEFFEKHEISQTGEIEQGLTAFINVFHNWASFESQSKIVLLNPEIQGHVAWLMSEIFRTHYYALQKVAEVLKSRSVK